MSYEMLIEPLGETIEVEEGQTILDAALRSGIYIPHACGHGLCGTCKVEIVDGEFDHGPASPFALMEFERDAGIALACCATLMEDIEIEADVDEDEDAEVIPVRDFHTTVSRIETLTPTIKAFYLTLDDKIHFQAGQYVQVHLPGMETSRAFSIANSPQQILATGEVELNVRLLAGGEATTYMHEQLQVADKVRISGPYGRFFVRKSAPNPMVFMAGGSGLSSPRSMIEDLLAEGSEIPITLIYGQRYKNELYYHQEFLEMAAKHTNFTYVPALSEPEDSVDWTGATGFVHEVAKQHFNNNFSGHKAYLCGPPVMIEACISTLMQGRLFERDIYTEKFLSAADVTEQRSPLFKRV
jgi:phenol hydroxylase P5 protein